MNRTGLLFILLCTFGCTLYAQQAPVYSQYMFNPFLINPAYAGSEQRFGASMHYRDQWSGWEGAPRTISALAHGRIYRERLALGVIVEEDAFGITRQRDALLGIAVHLPVRGSLLSFGFRGGMRFRSRDITKLNITDPGDPLITNQFTEERYARLGFGVQLQRERFAIGISMPDVFDADAPLSDPQADRVWAFPRRAMVLTSALSVRLSDGFSLRPSTLVWFEPDERSWADVNLSLVVRELFRIGCSYRSTQNLVAVTEWRATRTIRIAYSYDFALSGGIPGAGASHEVLLGVDLPVRNESSRSPRHF
ncbi:MAG: type IX secretion system membrane protein PorP/SprF [Bacteroidota bacterium]|jgi:type IX secretion system PorP/SprF family membrane protein